MASAGIEGIATATGTSSADSSITAGPAPRHPRGAAALGTRPRRASTRCGQDPAGAVRSLDKAFGQCEADLRSPALLDRQRDPPSRPGLRLSARARDRAAGVLRARLTRAGVVRTTIGAWTPRDAATGAGRPRLLEPARRRLARPGRRRGGQQPPAELRPRPVGVRRRRPRARRVLDAGCGTGYLSRKLRDRGARVTGVDLAERMIEMRARRPPRHRLPGGLLHRARHPRGRTFDLVVANYVLMDTPDLEAAMRAFARVLKPGRGGRAGLLPPLLPARADCRRCRTTAGRSPTAGTSPTSSRGSARTRRGATSRRVPLVPPAALGLLEGVAAAGFAVVGFEEPRVTEDRYHLAESEKKLGNSKTRPYSVAFKLRKPAR